MTAGESTFCPRLHFIIIYFSALPTPSNAHCLRSLHILARVGVVDRQQQGGGSGANTPPQTSSRPQSPTFGGQGMPSPEVLNRLAALESRLSQM